MREKGETPAAHHKLLIRHLEEVAWGRCRRLMVFMPPGSAKTTYGSRLFPGWFMGLSQHLNVIGASNTAELATAISRDVQGYIREEEKCLQYALARESAELWNTTTGCQYRAAGVGGTITGFRGDLAVIDDPIKSRKEADNKGVRDDIWGWYNADLLTRMKPSGRVVLIQTRWHEDDLGGRLLETQRHLWTVVNVPATAGEDDVLGRAPGALLWADDAYGYARRLQEARDEYERNGAMRDWYALYEQDPRPVAGGIFAVAKAPQIEEAPGRFTRVVRAWDFAATAQTGTRNPDWTVGLKMGVTEAGRYIVLDVMRKRGGPEQVENWLRQAAEEDGRGVTVCIPQDPGQAGKMQAAHYVKCLSGFSVKASPEGGDKATRASPFASQLNVGNVSIMKRAWTPAYVEELAGFPSAAKDDQVDASSRAFGELARGGVFRVQRLGY